MGEVCNCIGDNGGLDASNWISIAGIFINACLAGWIVLTIQSKLANRRVLKDHLIEELKEIRMEFRNCLNNIYSNKTPPKNVLPWFKLINIKIEDLTAIINMKYKINKDILRPYQNELRDLITESEDFEKQYEGSGLYAPSVSTKTALMKFQQRNSHLFNDVIIKINDAR